MKRAALFLALLLLARGGFAQPGTYDCSNADKKLKDGEIFAAKALYEAALKAGSSECAEAGIKSINQMREEAAVRLVRGQYAKSINRVADARAEFLDAVKIDPTFAEAMAALSEINGYVSKPPPPPLSEIRVRQLLRLHRNDDAVKALDEFLKTQPPTYIIPSDIVTKLDPYAEALALQRQGFIDEARTAMKSAAKTGRPVPVELAGLAETGLHSWTVVKAWLDRWGTPLAALLAAALAIALAWQYRPWQQLQLQIADFTPPDAQNNACGATMSALVRNAVGALAPEKPHYSIAAVTSPVEKLTIPEAVTTALPGGVSTIVKIVGLLPFLPRRHILKVEGRIHSPGIAGPGLTLSIVGAPNTNECVTVWQKEFDPGRFRTTPATFTASDYYALSEPAAVWVLFKVLEREHPGGRTREFWTKEFWTKKWWAERWTEWRTTKWWKDWWEKTWRTDKQTPQSVGPPYSALGTCHWRAYAFFRAALACAKADDHHSAEELYCSALREDEEFLAARVNFASELRQVPPDKVTISFAIEQYKTAVKAYEKNQRDPWRQTSPAYFSALYQLACACYDRSAAQHSLEEAAKYAKRLLDAIDPQKRNDAGKNDHLDSYLKQISPAAQAMHLGLEIELKPAELKQHLRKLQALNPGSPSSRFHYNVACSLIAAGKQARSKDKQLAFLKKADQRLTIAFLLEPALRTRAQGDRSLQLWRDWAKPKETRGGLREAYRAARSALGLTAAVGRAANS